MQRKQPLGIDHQTAALALKAAPEAVFTQESADLVFKRALI